MEIENDLTKTIWLIDSGDVVRLQISVLHKFWDEKNFDAVLLLISIISGLNIMQLDYIVNTFIFCAIVLEFKIAVVLNSTCYKLLRES